MLLRIVYILHDSVERGAKEGVVWVMGWRGGLGTPQRGVLLVPKGCAGERRPSHAFPSTCTAFSLPSPETSGRSCFPPGTWKTFIILHFWRKISIKFLGGRRQGRPHINPCAPFSHCPLPERLHRQKPSWCYLTWSITTSSMASAWWPCSSGRSCASVVMCQPMGCSCWMGYAETYFKHLGLQCLK